MNIKVTHTNGKGEGPLSFICEKMELKDGVFVITGGKFNGAHIPVIEVMSIETVSSTCNIVDQLTAIQAERARVHWNFIESWGGQEINPKPRVDKVIFTEIRGTWYEVIFSANEKYYYYQVYFGSDEGCGGRKYPHLKICEGDSLESLFRNMDSWMVYNLGVKLPQGQDFQI